MKRSKPAMRLYCWNVNGIRAVHKKGFLDWFRKASPDVLCLQETKAHQLQLETSLLNVEGFESHWSNAERKGYSGVATYTKPKPLAVQSGFGVPEFDNEGRVLITEYPEFMLFNIYFPNGKRDQVRLDFKLKFYRAILQYWQELRKKGKRLVICGDYNTAHKEIDLARPKENETISGFLPIEREWMDEMVGLGYVDTFRLFNQKPDQYTWWDMMTRARERNVGWRIDYFFVSQDLIPLVKNAWICPEVMGSDHCPIGMELEL